MKKMMNMLMALSILTFSVGASAIECSKMIGDIELNLSLNDDQAVITYNDETTVYRVSGVYDGHMTSFFTGEGIAITYQNHFGCIRNIKLTTILPHNIKEVSFAGCRGGSTPDDICHI